MLAGPRPGPGLGRGAVVTMWRTMELINFRWAVNLRTNRYRFIAECRMGTLRITLLSKSRILPLIAKQTQASPTLVCDWKPFSMTDV